MDKYVGLILPDGTIFRSNNVKFDLEHMRSKPGIILYFDMCDKFGLACPAEYTFSYWDEKGEFHQFPTEPELLVKVEED